MQNLINDRKSLLLCREFSPLLIPHSYLGGKITEGPSVEIDTGSEIWNSFKSPYRALGVPLRRKAKL